MFDYAFWGIVLALLLSELRTAGIVPETVNYWLSHPLMAPVIITGTWVGIETLLMASVGTTPGKWLFGCYVQYSISDAYARREMKSQIWRSFKRAFRVWWEGLGCGFPLIAPILIAIAYERLAQNHESDWDFAAGLSRHTCAARRAQPGDRRLRPRRDAVALWRRVAQAARGFDRQAWHVDRRIDAVFQSMIPKGLTDGSAITGVTGGIRPPRWQRAGIPAGRPERRAYRFRCGDALRRPPGARSGAEGRRAARPARRVASAVPPSSAARGRTSSSPTPKRGVAWAMRCREPGAIRRLSTPTARRSSSILPIARSMRPSTAARRGSSATS
jgi:hypothetical protein